MHSLTLTYFLEMSSESMFFAETNLKFEHFSPANSDWKFVWKSSRNQSSIACNMRKFYSLSPSVSLRRTALSFEVELNLLSCVRESKKVPSFESEKGKESGDVRFVRLRRHLRFNRLCGQRDKKRRPMPSLENQPTKYVHFWIGLCRHCWFSMNDVRHRMLIYCIVTSPFLKGPFFGNKSNKADDVALLCICTEGEKSQRRLHTTKPKSRFGRAIWRKIKKGPSWPSL